MKSVFKKILISCLALAMLISNVFAASNTNSWSISESGTGEEGKYSLFWPTSGTLTAYYYGGAAVTDLNFTYQRATADEIENQKASNRFPGMEVRDYSKNEKDNFSAHTITTNLPDPKIDCEDDFPCDGRNEEAEVTVLGTIEAGKYYYMSIDWKDHRNGLAGGNWGVKAEISKKGVIDYNVSDYKYLHSDVFYGPTYGEYRVLEPEMSEAFQSTKMDTIPSTITFNKYMSLEEFEIFISEIETPISYAQLRGIDESGDRITIFTMLDKGWDETKELINAKAEDKRFSVKGVVAVYANLDGEQINILQNRSDVYSIDSAVTIATNSTDLTLPDGFPHSIAWELEDLDILQ